MKAITFTSGTIEKTHTNMNIVILYNKDKVVYKFNENDLNCADLYCKYKNLKYITN